MKDERSPVDFDSPRAISAYLAERGLALKKRWGQNFMISPAARERIISLLAPHPAETVWEVGPGLGAMTVELSRRVGRLVLFEIDWGLVRHLEEFFAENPIVKIYPGDVLETWKKARDAEGEPAALFGNLPYRSAAMLIGTLLEDGFVPRRLVFTVQREVAQRLAASPGSRDYSGISALVQCYCRVEQGGELKPGAFYPAPEVVSAIVRLDRRTDGPDVSDPRRLARLIRASFARRRKTLLNNLAASGFGSGRGSAALERILEACEIPARERAERVAPETFILLDRLLAEAQS